VIQAVNKPKHGGATSPPVSNITVHFHFASPHYFQWTSWLGMIIDGVEAEFCFYLFSI
jgi:hypothetical protein